MGRLFEGEICCPKLVPVFTICPCRGVNHYQNASSQTKKTFQNTHVLKPLDCEWFCARLLNTQLVCEIKKSASEDCASSALLCSLEVMLVAESSPPQVTKAVKSPRLLIVLLGVSQILLT